MNNTLKAVLIVLAALVLAGGFFFAGQVYGRWGTASAGYPYMPMMGGFGRGGNDDGYGRGPANGNNGYPGMMGGGYGPMMNGGNGYGPGGGMMGGNGYNPRQAANVQPLTVDEAKTAAQTYLTNLKLDGLEVGEVMVFDNNAYVVVKETSTGLGAFELLVDPSTKTAYPEHGPNMMWNLKYGGVNHSQMMNGRGMMGGYAQTWSTTPASVTPDMTVTPEQAIKDAQAYLDQYLPGRTAATDPIQFYGYYTIDFEQDGKVAGMLSVNGFSGEVFVHNWHGTFVTESQ